MELQIADQNQISIKSGIAELGIFEKGNDAWVSSRDIAKLFDKRHDHVLRDIEDAMSKLSEKFTQPNFGESSYKNSQNKKQPEYLLNRKSFSLIAMGYTGKKAMEFKIAYIEAFEAMYNVIETRLLSKAGYREMTAAIAKRYNNDPRTFSLEADMINEIVLGMKAKDFKTIHQIDNNGHTRDHVVMQKLILLDKAERLNAQLIHAGINFEARKAIINSNFNYKKVA
ncbi:MAG: Rha family transcriptional regulator [Spirochaetes bacterium]|nr:Rha family transcriptional regulator [Spirochaetota bacterium]